MPARSVQLRFWLALCAWAAAALGLAALRVPFDDEWFSLELAHEASVSQLWAALAADVHPPWLALLDRALAQLGPEPLWLQGARVACSAVALALTARVIARGLSVPRLMCVCAALHPIVLFYAGAARWYPVLWLAHALRLRAIWHERPAGAASAALFASGSALGSLATYLDPLFLLHDAAWLVLRSRRAQVRGWRSALVVCAAAVVCASSWFASPLTAPLPHQPGAWLPLWSTRELASFWLLGLAGEAALAWPAWLLGAACVCASVLGVRRALLDPATRPLGTWLVSYAACWLLACGFGIDHPRYGLLLWVSVPCFWLRYLLPTAAGERSLRVLSVGSLTHLLLGLYLVLTGQGFLKSDLNELAAVDCVPLRAAPPPRAVFVAYARLESLVRKRCAVALPLVRVPSIRIVPNATEQLAPVRRHWIPGGSFWLLSVNTDVSYARTAERVRAHLQARCRLQDVTDFARIPHPGLSPQRSASYRRFKLERFNCP